MASGIRNQVGQLRIAFHRACLTAIPFLLKRYVYMQQFGFFLVDICHHTYKWSQPVQILPLDLFIVRKISWAKNQSLYHAIRSPSLPSCMYQGSGTTGAAVMQQARRMRRGRLDYKLVACRTRRSFDVDAHVTWFEPTHLISAIIQVIRSVSSDGEKNTGVFGRTTGRIIHRMIHYRDKKITLQDACVQYSQVNGRKEQRRRTSLHIWWLKPLPSI